MLQQFNQNWQMLLADDPGYTAWMAKDEEERMAAILAEMETRSRPYGPPEADYGYPWEGETPCLRH